VWTHVKRHTTRFWNIKKKQQRRDKNKMEISKYTPEQRRAAEMLLRERRGGGSEPSDEILAISYSKPTVKKQQERKADAEPRKPLSREPSFLELLKDDAEEAITAFYEAPTTRSPVKGSLNLVQSVAAAADSTAVPDPNLASEVVEQKTPVEMPRNEPRPTIQNTPAPTSILKRSPIHSEDPKEQNMGEIRKAVAKSCGGKKAAKGGRVPENVVLRSAHHPSDAFSNLADVRLVGLLHEPLAWQPDLAQEVAEAKLAHEAHEAQEAPVTAGSILDPPLSSFLKDAHAPQEPVVEHIPRHFKSDLLWLHPPRSVPASSVVVSDRQEFHQKVVYEVPPIEYADQATAALIARQRRRQGVPDKVTVAPVGKIKKGAAGRSPAMRLPQSRKEPLKRQEDIPEPVVCDQPEVPAFEWSKARASPTSSINSRMPRPNPRQAYQIQMRQVENQKPANVDVSKTPTCPLSPSSGKRMSEMAKLRTSPEDNERYPHLGEFARSSVAFGADGQQRAFEEGISPSPDHIPEDYVATAFSERSPKRSIVTPSSERSTAPSRGAAASVASRSFHGPGTAGVASTPEVSPRNGGVGTELPTEPTDLTELPHLSF
jgi:hypothetical protein